MSKIQVLQAGLTLTTGEAWGLDPKTNVALSVVDGWDGGGSIKRTSTSRLNRHGEYSERGYRGGRLVTVTGYTEKATRQEAAQFVLGLEACLADGTAGRLTVVEPDLGMTRFLDPVYLQQGAEITRTDASVRFTMEMLATDPLKKSAPVTVQAEEGWAAAHNLGTAPAELVFTLTGTIPGAFVITENSTQRSLQWSNGPDTSGTLVIDVQSGRARLSGQDVTTSLYGRDWPELKAGAREDYVFFAFNGATPTFTVRTTSQWH